jgi:hypothetical protein
VLEGDDADAAAVDAQQKSQGCVGLRCVWVCLVFSIILSLSSPALSVFLFTP